MGRVGSQNFRRVNESRKSREVPGLYREFPNFSRLFFFEDYSDW